MTKQLEKLLQSSIDQHGYWLINHREQIEKPLQDGLKYRGLPEMIEQLNDIQSPYVKALYQRIENYRATLYCPTDPAKRIACEGCQ